MRSSPPIRTASAPTRHPAALTLNVLHAAPPHGDAALEAADLADWPAATERRLEQFRTTFEAGVDEAALATFRAKRGATLEAHARFEALHAHFYGQDERLWNWRTWPEPYRDPASPAVAAFAYEQARTVAFHAWLQMQADCGLSAAQAAARDAGMRVGLIEDLAVGADAGGSQGWSRQAEMLNSLSVGAPPDLLQHARPGLGPRHVRPARAAPPRLSPRSSTCCGAALRHGGGVRIDHAMGLQRLWLVPHGADAADGAYVNYPLTDLLRLVTLESSRHRAIVVAEDLGTVPEGFSERLTDTGILGMRVLWFESDGDRFRPPSRWSPRGVAMTSTHDLPTVAGWWRGRDIDWRARIGLVPDVPAARRERARERAELWQSFRDSGAAEPDAPPPEDAGKFATAACAHVANAACQLALLPIEDALALIEQPNLPGSQSEHPNWRRRLDGPAGALLDPPDVAARIAAIAAARMSTPGTG